MDTLILIMFFVVVGIGLSLLIFMSLTRKSGKMLDQAKYRSRWLAITQQTGSTPESWQFAIISADKLLDTALRERGVHGDTLGERLKNAKPFVSNLDGVWRAHKLRNRIAHEDGINVTRRQATEALKIFKKALTDLGAL